METNAARFDFGTDVGVVAGLRAYFEIVMRWNPRLHLVAPCTPAEFAMRHVLESLIAAPHLPAGARVVDVGSGAGLPVIPCLIARPDLRALLVESSRKKAVFLREALVAVSRGDAAEVLAERFQSAPPPAADALTCRALERFTEVIPELLSWSSRVKRLLLFGGHLLGAELEKAGLTFSSVLIPESERRFLFVVDKK
ncbi:MAG TPA: RsmG family class I SAM-dependent methyltransferase [Pyrinomonadaceae bacterium]